MTYNVLYRHIVDLLKKAGCEAPAFDTLCLFEYKLNMNRHSLIMDGDKTVPNNEEKEMLYLAEKRASGYPLQYLVEKWSFMDWEFFVGEGVLIPREDTSVVVQLCIDKAKKLYGNQCSLNIIDLCAGSGAISIALEKSFENSNVTALEFSHKAMKYLQKNIQHNNCTNVTAVNGDVFTDYQKYENEQFDIIISNPPYIITDEIPQLQKEVQHEPVLALDGGSDGYRFYCEIVEKWSKALKVGGLLVFELGENQYDTVKHLMEEKGFANIDYSLDIQDIKRGICGVKTVQ